MECSLCYVMVHATRANASFTEEFANVVHYISYPDLELALMDPIYRKSPDPLEQELT